MELRNLAAFVAVVEKKSFIQAATQLHRSQPAITAQIQRLEEELGVVLLDRRHQGVRMTPAGEAFLPGARATLFAAEEAARAAKLVTSQQVERLRLGFPRSVSREIIPKIVSEFHKLHPNVKLELTPFGTSTVIIELQREAIDLGFVRLPMKAKGIDIVPAHREPLLVCLPRDHRLAAAEEVSIADLRGERFVMYGRKWAPGFYDLLLERCLQAGFSPVVSSEIDEMYVAPALVAAGDGIAILPSMVIQSSTQNVILKPLIPRDLFSEIGIATRARDRSPMIRTAVSISKAICKQLSI